MARPLRIERPGGRYHVTARGNERRDIFRDDPDRFHFLELLSEIGERFGARVHAYVLMDNHYHLLLESAGGIGGLLARTDSDSACYHSDASGNVTCLINCSNSVAARYAYDPFGN